MYYYWLSSPAQPVVYVPSRYIDIVRKIYDRLQCSAEFREGQAPSGHGTLEVKINSGAARGNLYVGTIGENTVSMIRHTRRELVERAHVEVVFVDLLIGNSATTMVAEQLESVGFGFGFVGIAPHFSKDGDLLRLAYLVEPVEREPIHTLDEVAGEMVDYALKEQKRLQAILA